MSLQAQWYGKATWAWVLLPLSVLFYLISTVRRWLYYHKWLNAYQSELPVLIVGNITVGGNGKTPVVLALAEHLQQKGLKCAVLSRGYGGSQDTFPHLLTQNSKPSVVGDEPALISQRLGIPVVIDPKRSRGARFIEQQTDAQVIICDDGLQHYALKRDIELCVTDSRGFGNGYLLPLGPLRESKKRLSTVDWVVVNGAQSTEALNIPKSNFQSNMRLAPSCWVNVKSKKRLSLTEARALFCADTCNIVALAGIGDPSRFFDTLLAIGIRPNENIGFSDHHKFSKADMPDARFVLMTEKDAVKCASFAEEHYWYLQVDAELSSELLDDVFNRIDNKANMLGHTKE